ncbi:MAG: Rha family transcriptional regulator [Selenomonadaceae bacterium]|nr:Rha family transcriptional regulator [Selenomonadaceae bacterium]
MKDNTTLVFIKNDTPLTTSRTVAEQFDKQHQHVMRDIRDIISQVEDESKIGRMFHETTYADKYGRQKPMYTMTRDGFSLLAMGFTGKKALEFKLKFIDAFNRMEQALSVPQIERDARWLETRQGTKISHRPFTDAIKLLISHLRQHGEKRADGYIYGHLTNIMQNACGVRRGQRDNAPVAYLNKLDQVQSMIANLILQLIANRPDIKSLEQFEATIMLQLDQLNRWLGGQCPLIGGGATA